MSNATDQARSTRSDARAFADAFAEADDAFTFGPDAGESRTLTLDELGEVLALDGPVALPGPRRPQPVVAETLPADDELMTLDELGEALASRAREADALNFDFGTSAHERARRRTAARLEASPAGRRRVSGPASRLREHTDADGSRGRTEASTGRFVPSGRATVADAAASAAERMAGAGRFAREGNQSDPSRTPAAGSAALRADGARRSAAAGSAAVAGDAAAPTGHAVALTGRSDASPRRLRELDRSPGRVAADRLRANPDRIAMWAVLLGIVLILIAFTSGSAGAVALPLVAAL